MSATLSSVEQKVYNKVMASKKKAMTLAQIESAIPGLSKRDLNTAINNILRLKLFTASKNKDDTLIFNAVAVEDAKKQNTLTEEQQFVLSIIDKAGNKGISKPSIASQINAEIMPRSQVFKAIDALEKSQLIKTFKSVNAPTMPLYILAHLKPPEDIAGGVWFDESKEYDSVFVDSLRGVVFSFISQKTFPSQKGKDSISKLCPNPIYPVAKTPALPTPAAILRHIENNKVTSAQLTVKNVMEICRALELDGLIESIKPVGGVSLDYVYESESDPEPVSKKHRSRADSDDDLDDEQRARRERKEREKMKAKLKEQKREKLRRERAKEKERRKKEKEKEKKRKAKEKKRREKEKKRKRKDKDKKKPVLSDDSDDELRAIDDKPKRKRRVVLSDDSDAGSSSATDDITSDSDTSDSDSDTDSDASVSSVDSDDLDNGAVSFKPQSTALAGISANPFFSADGRQTLIDLSDQAVLYRATRRLGIPLGQMQAPCGNCPQFNFCEEGGPVNAAQCTYFSDWLSGTSGGWTADVKAEKAAKAAEQEKARRRALAEANGEAYVEGEDGEEPNGEAIMGLELDEYAYGDVGEDEAF